VAGGDGYGRIRPTRVAGGDGYGRIRPTRVAGGDGYGRIRPTRVAGGDGYGRIRPTRPVVARIDEGADARGGGAQPANVARQGRRVEGFRCQGHTIRQSSAARLCLEGFERPRAGGTGTSHTPNQEKRGRRHRPPGECRPPTATLQTGELPPRARPPRVAPGGGTA
jgi:hypothetical protein